jgi:sigma-B regulation protein RsbU (phosphoserine phosphatase)
MNTILHERQLEPYYCTLCYALFDLKRRSVVIANSGLPYPVRCTGDTAAQIVLPGVPIGAFAGSAYDEVSFDLSIGDVYVFCTDGVFETTDAQGRDFGAERLTEVVLQARKRSARAIVDEVLAAVTDFRGDRPQRDDMTVVALRVTS